MQHIHIEDNAEARAWAERHGVAEDMLTSARVREHAAVAGDVGFVILRKSGILLPSGRMEILLFCLFSQFFKGSDNGWAVCGWTEIEWIDLPWVAEKLLEAERIAPEVMHEGAAIEKMKSKGVEPMKDL